MPTHRVFVIGAGIGGLVAALDLARQGLAVTVLERAATPGGKMREVAIDGARLDAGPTVFTLRSVFDAIFADAGTTLDAHLTLRPVDVLARHAWTDGARLDLFTDIDRSADAIGAFAGAAEAQGYRDFCAQSQHIYQTLDRPFMRAPRPTPLSLAREAGLRGLGDLWRIMPFETLWRALGAHFRDPRLRQLFARYATYSGASPFLAPATLMLIAHVEREGVWLIEGGMHRLATTLARLASMQGATIRYGCDVAEILVSGGKATGVRLADGERLAADAVVVNADAGALPAGLFGAAVARAVVAPASRSLSAVTWNLVAPTRGFPLLRHTVFFSDNYAAEFDAVFRDRRLPGVPTVYVCAQDRNDTDTAPGTPERLLCLVNAPATGDSHNFDAAEIEACASRTFQMLARCGLQVDRRAENTVTTTPTQFEKMFPATGGALYGPAVHGAMASFRRPGARSAIPRLYLAGGSVHPGPGVPMAALSGRMAASSLIADLAPSRSVSTRRFRRAAMSGGTSMR